MLNFKNALIAILLLVAIGLSCHSLLITHKIGPLNITDAANQPDAYIENVSATLFNKQGVPALKIEAPKMTHYRKKDTTFIEMPHITFYRQSPQPWHINAAHAMSSPGIEKILFWNNVIIFHQEDNQNPTTTIKTAELTIFPNQKIAKTNRPVSLFQSNAAVYGVGMLANLKIGSVKLLSQTRSDYVPKS